jgi:hypothetical protein
VVRVQNDGNAIGLGDLANVVGTSDGSEDGGGLTLVRDTLSGVESSTTVGELDDNGRLVVTSSLYLNLNRGIEREMRVGPCKVEQLKIN